MNYEGVNNVTCDAQEQDWLDVTTTQSKYQDKPVKRKFRLNKLGVFVLVAVAVVGALCALMIIDGDFSAKVFETANTAYLSVAGLFDKNNDLTIHVPCNATITSVDNGVATFGGGRTVLSFTEGIVSSVTQDSVTVQVNEDTSITYGNLVTTYVSVGDKVSCNNLIGKYETSATATVTYKGEVAEVIGSENSISWQV